MATTTAFPLSALLQSGATSGQIPIYNSGTGKWAPGSSASANSGLTQGRVVGVGASGVLVDSSLTGLEVRAPSLVVRNPNAASNADIQFQDVNGTTLMTVGSHTDATGKISSYYTLNITGYSAGSGNYEAVNIYGASGRLASFMNNQFSLSTVLFKQTFSSDEFCSYLGSGLSGYAENYLKGQSYTIALYANPQGSNYTVSGRGTYYATSVGIITNMQNMVLGVDGVEKFRITSTTVSFRYDNTYKTDFTVDSGGDLTVTPVGQNITFNAALTFGGVSGATPAYTIFRGASSTLAMISGAGGIRMYSFGVESYADFTISNLGDLTISPVGSTVLVSNNTSAYVVAKTHSTAQCGLGLQDDTGWKWLLYKPGSSDDLRFWNGTDRLIVNSSGHLYPTPTLSNDLGGASNYWRNVYASSYLAAAGGAFSFNTRSMISSPGDGYLQLADYASGTGTNFIMLAFGPSGTAHPALKRNGTAMEVKLADDSGYTTLASGNHEPGADNTYYLGKNDDDSPKAWKGIILKDQTTGTYYRVQVDSGALTVVDLTD